MLVEEVAHLRLNRSETPDAGGSGRAPDEPAAALGRAQRQALIVTVLCWVALAALFIMRPKGASFLSFDGEQAVFSGGVLTVAVYSGFRLGQWEKLRAVARACAAIAERDPGG
jgi:hypothetical protein